MGNCGGKEIPMTKEEKAMLKVIENELRKTKRKMETEIKLLLLGAGESGKSTIAKQMKMIYLNGFTEEERKSYKEIIHSNVVLSMRTLLLACEKLEIELSAEAKEKAATFLSNSILIEQELDAKAGEHLKWLWTQEPGIKQAYARASEFQINDSASYYFDAIDRIVGDFIPTEQDILRARAKTTGITETEFTIGKNPFRMCDVGGQRSERKKWIHCFQDVTAVIFCVALSEYDQKLHEDDSVNRMHESLKLFDEICNSRWFLNTSIVLFLNKSDLFKEKIAKVDLNVCFADYDGGLNYDKASGYIREKFVNLNRDPSKKQIYTHITCATDTENVKFVFNSVKDIFLQQGLQTTGY
eukprot:TRINITY_DN11828_c0_g1_i1.p1 TRINITY_DN11828_c0_g1~~TRINITY_DN11828_c0_g1_i1.p1  ORF type:complete len:355 (-),score=96.66 TRINITY_DN11828_c0_g1_i1:128-1192(-)